MESRPGSFWQPRKRTHGREGIPGARILSRSLILIFLFSFFSLFFHFGNRKQYVMTGFLPSIYILYLLYLQGAGANPNTHRVRGGVHPGQVA